MGKYVLLKARVPVTFDFGFRSSGYDVVDMLETDEPLDLRKGSLQIFMQKRKKR